MKSNIGIAILWLIIGGLLGAAITYNYAKCKTSGVNIQLNANDKSGPALTITKTGDKE